MEKDLKICNRCRKEKSIENFLKNGKELKTCINCREKRLCQHGKYKYRCVECGGASICQHGRVKIQCKPCGGTSICQHGRRKAVCIECGGTYICPHGKRKNICKECDGVSICPHGKVRNRCKECDGCSFCQHDRRKERCKECNGVSICEHKRQRSNCKECNGSSICLHGRRRNVCKDCDGVSICIHKKQKASCPLCTPAIACKNCLYGDVRRSKYKPYCFQCYRFLNPDAEISRTFRFKEHYLRDRLIQEFTDIKFIFDRTLNACSLRRPDIFIERFTHAVIIECDEDEHSNYICENKRTMEIFQDLGNRPLVMIRFNPDSYTIENNRFDGCFKITKKGLTINKKEWERRIKILVSLIKSKLNELPIKELDEIKLFYSQKS